MNAFRWGLVLLLVGVALGVWWLQASDARSEGAPQVVRAPAEVPELDVPVVAVSVSPDSETLALQAEPLAGNTTPSAPSNASADTLALLVQHAHGAPARGARVGLQRDVDSPWLAAGWLDDAGRFASRAFDDPIDVVIVGATRAPERFRLDVARGEHTLTLPEGAVIAGRVLIDGAPPGEPFPIGLSGYRHPSLKLDGEVRFPRFARPGFVETVYGSGVFTEADGSFLISGLPADEELNFKWPRLHRLVERDSTPLPVRAPHDDVVISLQAPKYLFGRVIHSDGTAATEASLRAVTKVASQPGWQHGNPRPSSGGPKSVGPSSASGTYSDLALDSEARFFVALGDLLTAQGSLPSVERGELDVERLSFSVLLDFESQHGVASLEFDELDLTRDHNVGDVELHAPALARLHIVDTEDRAIVGARVRAEVREGFAPVFDADADAEGRVEFRLPSGALGVVTVVAPGFESVRFAPLLVSDASEERVVLRAANSLTLNFLGPWADGEPRDEWLISGAVFSSGSPFQDASHPPVDGLEQREDSDPLRARDGEANGGTTMSWENGDILVGRATRADSLRFEALRTHHPITAYARLLRAPESAGLEQGAWVWEQEVWLEVGEQRELTVDLRDIASLAPAVK
ncbi:MAG: hypothetical protein DHS20C15_28470 [Planctomycetota bacterium]|nr:MAG: hypothetical protein DHS20C15_28470 [Planctomycetota bacterium]